MRWIQSWDGDWVNMDLLANISIKVDGKNFHVYGYWTDQTQQPINLYGPFNSRPEAQEHLDNLFTGK